MINYPDEFWMEYCRILYEELKNLKIRGIKNSYKVYTRLANFNFSRGVVIWELKFERIHRVKDDCLRHGVFRRETAFVEKLNICNKRLAKIDELKNKILGIEIVEFRNKRAFAVAQRLFGVKQEDTTSVKKLFIVI